MKAAILFTGTGPILILTTFKTIDNPELIKKLETKNIKKFIAYEIHEDKLKEKYGMHFDIILGDLKQTDDLRVLDYDGHHIFNNFSLSELGEPIYHE